MGLSTPTPEELAVMPEPLRRGWEVALVLAGIVQNEHAQLKRDRTSHNPA